VAIGLEAIRMLEEGVATAEDIDRAMELGYNHPMGPLRLTDLVGLDVRLSIAEYLHSTLGQRFEPPRLLRKMVEAGTLGKKSGRGFYAWKDGKPVKAAAGAVPAGLADRLVGPYVAEARAALDEGIVADADLVDAGAIFGTGFAPFRGGPLHFAGVSKPVLAAPQREPAPVV
jgi:3-hydroxyacyl-CoA dehydrogenase/enoyl-CoA hydratase/3-hydroxybutyryl-CoA epimerase